jgi:hypothetical protein
MSPQYGILQRKCLYEGLQFWGSGKRGRSPIELDKYFNTTAKTVKTRTKRTTKEIRTRTATPMEVTAMKRKTGEREENKRKKRIKKEKINL